VVVRIGCALIRDVPTCAQLIERLVAEAVDAVEALPACVVVGRQASTSK
jgi:hypothetical protein